MALKDWKLIGHNLGRNHDVSEWWNQSKKLTITTRRDWNNVIVAKRGKEILERKFKYQYQKIKFIKSYMRKH